MDLETFRYTPIPDSALVRRSITGSASAFEALYRRYQGKASAIARAHGLHADAVDDVVQESFLVAYRDLDSLRSAERFGPWFLAIVRNASRRSRRRSTRSDGVVRDGYVESEPAGREPDPSDSVQAGELNARLWKLVRGLPDGVREAVFLYYHDGRSVREVKRALGLSASAVKSRLKRGRDALRGRLWRELGDAIREAAPPPHVVRRRGRALALLILATLEPLGASAATDTAGRTASTNSSSTLMTGALMASTNKLPVAAIAAILLLALASSVLVPAFFREESVPSPTEPHARSEIPETGPADVPDVPTGRPDSGDEVSVATPETRPPPPFGSARLRAVWQDDGAPAEGVHLRLVPWGISNPHLDEILVVTGDEGIVDVEDIPAGSVGIYVDRGGGGALELEPGGHAEKTIEIPSGQDVRGVVVDADGLPVANADIWLSGYGNYTSGIVVTQTDLAGRFELFSVTPSRYVGARSARHAPSLLTHIGESIRELRLVLPGPGGTVEGRVLDPDGAPVADAALMIGAERGRQVRLPDGSSRHAPAPVLARTDLDGRFRVSGVAPGRTPVAVRVHGFAPWSSGVEVRAGESSTVDVRLEPGVTVHGVVRDEDGDAIGGVFVGVGIYHDFLSSNTRSGGNGEYELTSLASGSIEVSASERGLGKASIQLRGGPGDALRWDPVLSAGRKTRGRVMDERGQPLAGWSVNAFERVRNNLKNLGGGVRTDGQGRFKIINLKDGPYAIGTFAPGQSAPSVWIENVRPDDEEIVLRVADDMWPTARVAGRVVDSLGRPVGRAQVFIWHPILRSSATSYSDEETGVFDAGPMAPGVYNVEVRAPGYPRKVVGDRELLPEETLDLGDVLLGDAGHLEVTVKRDDGVDVRGAFVQIIDAGGENVDQIEVKGRSGRSGPLAPGAYEVRISGGGVMDLRRDVEVRAEETTEIDVALRAGAPRRLILLPPAGGLRPGVTVELRVRDGAGELVMERSSLPVEGGQELKVFGTFAVGRYAVEAWVVDGGIRWQGSFEIREAGGRSERLEFRP